MADGAYIAVEWGTTNCVLAVGGIFPDTMASWRAAGADGFGLGSNLYTPGKSAVAADAATFLFSLKDLA